MLRQFSFLHENEITIDEFYVFIYLFILQRRVIFFCFVLFAVTKNDRNSHKKSPLVVPAANKSSSQSYPKQPDTVMVDLSKMDLDLDEVDGPSSYIVENKNTISMEPLSASKLQLLQDTTMIESPLDLDSLEESTSSVGANSHAGLIKNKHTL